MCVDWQCMCVDWQCVCCQVVFLGGQCSCCTEFLAVIVIVVGGMSIIFFLMIVGIVCIDAAHTQFATLESVVPVVSSVLFLCVALCAFWWFGP